MLDAIKQWFNGLYEQFQKWLIDFLLWIPRKLWQEFLDSMAELIEGVPVPDYVTKATQLLGSWSADAAYWFDLLQFNWGIALVLSAIGTRWAWSKIPFIGR